MGGVLRVALGGFVALIFSGAPLLTYTQSLFLEPMMREFGWSRTQYFLPLAIGGTVGALFVPMMGKAADRFGLRTILLPNIVLFGLFYALLGMLGGSLILYGLLIFLLIVFQSAHGVLLYAKAVSLWPARRPGLMFAITLAGAAAGGIIVPPLTGHLIALFGWREARLILAALVLIVPLPIAVAFVRPPGGGRAVSGTNLSAAIGLSPGQALRSRTFWLVLLTIGLSGTAINGMVANIVPMLVGQGLSRAFAAFGLSVIAGTQLAGRLFSGLLLDKIATPRIALPLLVSPLIGACLLGLTTSAPVMLLAVVLLGLGLGSEMEMAAYFVRRYFGSPSYAQIYGSVLTLYIIGANTGPLLLGWMLDVSGSFKVTIGLVVALLAPSVLCLMMLPSYTFAGAADEAQAG